MTMLGTIVVSVVGTALILIVNSVMTTRRREARLLSTATVHLVVGGGGLGTTRYDYVDVKTLDYTSEPWISFVTREGLYIEATCPYAIMREERE